MNIIQLFLIPTIFLFGYLYGETSVGDKAKNSHQHEHESQEKNFQQKELEKIKSEIGIIEKLDEKIPLNLSFSTSENFSISLQNIFNKSIPTIIVPVYYRCPHMCPLILKGLRNAVEKEDKYELGSDYQIVTFSINPDETYQDALQRKKEIYKNINIPQKDEKLKHWYFLTTENEKDIQKLTDAIGFQYKKVGVDYSHTASLIFSTSDATIARYLYRMSYPKLDFRLAILETLQGKITSVKDHVLLFCFRYISSERKYQIIAWKVMIVGISITTFIFLLLLGIFWRREFKRKKNQAP